MAGRKRAPKQLRERVEGAIEAEGIVALAKRVGIATNTLYRLYRGDSVNSTTIVVVEAAL